MQSQVNNFFLDQMNTNVEKLLILMDKNGLKSLGTYVEQVYGNVHKTLIAGTPMIMVCHQSKERIKDLFNLIY